ncbi:MAG: OmpA family protein [Prevotellaceae bacterium]|jgi:outer membrane protein OmpA-like peptidoglycan-associated protein|nr:OmpA family protein [Prevotellaceae bacterium]
MRKSNLFIVVLLSVSLIFSGCETIKNTNNTTKGAVIGTAGGAAVGAGVGKLAGSTALGAIIGAAVGGVAGGLIGKKMDKQAAELKKIEGAQVERVEEGIKVTFESGLLFATNKSDLNATSKNSLTQFAQSLKTNPDTEVLIVGHTDATGSNEINQPLSERRAQAVADFLKQQGISTLRLNTMGYGSSHPIADNSTAAGRTQNRRVEVAIYASEDMVKKAESGSLY